MEDKLLELKEQFCKWYCNFKINGNYTDHVHCCECNKDIYYEMQEMCEICKVSNYIKFIRDELGGK